MWEFVPKSKSLTEGKGLFHVRVENEGIFVNYKWINRKGVPFLFVLSGNNVMRCMEMDPKKEVPKEPAEFKIDYNSMDIRLIYPSKNFAKDVDETFGFDNMGASDKTDREIMNTDEAKEPNFNIPSRLDNRSGRIPKDVTATAFDANSEGFVVASTGGILSYFKFPEQGKHKEKKTTFYNLHSFQIANITREKIAHVYVDSGKFKLLSLILSNDATVSCD
jgi:hypothetical protein